MTDYEALILRIVRTPTATVFAYRWGETLYSTVVAEVEGGPWLVMMGLNGLMETAFPPEDPGDVFGKSVVSTDGNAGRTRIMNRLITHYYVDVQHPEVSGAKHLEMLYIRDRLAEIESTLTSAEQDVLSDALRRVPPPHLCMTSPVS